MNKPLVSIIIPSYNGTRYLSQAIDSVLAQTFKDWELLVIDDASTDETEALVSKYLTDARIKYIKNEKNLGISKTRNKGLSLANSDSKYIAMLDNDDIWINKNKLEEQIKTLQNNPQLGIVGTWLTQIDKNGKELRNISFGTTDPEIRASILNYNHIAQSSVMFRKDVATAVGGYDESLATMEDHDLWLKIGTKWQFATLPSHMIGYRVHSAGITKKRAFQVSRDEFAVILRHGKKYPGYIKGLIKGLARPCYYALKGLF